MVVAVLRPADHSLGFEGDVLSWRQRTETWAGDVAEMRPRATGGGVGIDDALHPPMFQLRTTPVAAMPPCPLDDDAVGRDWQAIDSNMRSK